MTGILYTITNKINGKQYVGKTYDTVAKRFQQHKFDAQKERNKNRPLYRAFNKYGTHNFGIHIILTAEQHKLEKLEIEWIEKLGTYKNGYNATLGGDGKRYVEYSDEYLINLYRETQSLTEIYQTHNICEDTLRQVLKRNNIPIKWKNYRKVEIVNVITNELKLFNSIRECANWLCESDWIHLTNEESVISHLKRYNGRQSKYLKVTFEKR